MKISPVIHTRNPKQAIEQATVAFDAGSDGVFLINHGETKNRGDRVMDLLGQYSAVAERFKGKYIGLNYLVDPVSGYKITRRALELGLIPRVPDALWFDSAVGWADTPEERAEYLAKLDELRASPNLERIQLLGGVAFKYTQDYTPRPHKAARAARRLMSHVDVVTTSGAGTGHSPSPSKIRAMKRAIGEKKLAVASGVDAANLGSYGNDIDHVLVASSLETEPYSGIFIPSRVRELVRLAHGDQH